MMQAVRALGEALRWLRFEAMGSLPQGRGTATPGPGAGGADPSAEPPEDRGSDIVVTLSSIPSRIGRIAPALASLLDQTVPPREIVLALPERSRREGRTYRVPDAVGSHPRIRVVRTGRDWGPATKLLPTLRAHAHAPDTPVLAVDDDNIYPRTFVETFARWAGRLPDAALTLRGCRVPPSRRWRDCREFKGAGLRDPAPTDIVQGCAGILVRPRFFDEALFDYRDAPEGAFYVDDLWISGHLARRRVPAWVLPFAGPFVYLSASVTFRAPRLDRGENRSGANADAVLEHFAGEWGWR